AAALDHFDRALTLLGGSRGRWVSAARAMVASSRTMLLWELGERDRAEATMAELAATPPGAWYELRRRAVRLLRAYRLDDDRDLPDDDTLIDWAKGLLRRNHPFPDMALLAWVFERRGDADMVALLLGELAQRLPVPYERLVLMYPSLDPWLGPRLADLPAEPEL
ncbi:MAG: hypothetical protein KC464_03210, partial [Myxococcales bacterium]|nr:hypothetical protein [Myxococcales bacterium]